RKKMHDDEYIVATVADYEIAYELMLPILTRAFATLTQRALALLAAVLAHSLQGPTFTRADCQVWSGVGLTEVRHRLALLVEAGLVEQVAGGKGVRYLYRVVSTKPAKTPPLDGLITPDELRKQLQEEAKQQAASSKGKKSAKHK